MKRFAIAALSLLILGTMVTPVLAQFERSDFYDTPMGSIYVSKEPNSYNPYWQLFPTFTQEFVYVVAEIDFADIGVGAQNVSNGIRAWEGGVTIPEGVNVLGNDWEGAINLGTGAGDYIVGIGTPIITAASTPTPLVTFSFLALAAVETQEMMITASSSPSFPATPSSIWIEELTLNGCQNVQNQLPTQCFFVWEFTGSMWISSGITNETESWGGLKSRFDR